MAVPHLAVLAPDTPPLAAGCFIALVHPDFLQVAVTGNDDGGTGIQCERHELVVIGITADPFICHYIEKLNQLGKLGEVGEPAVLTEIPVKLFSLNPADHFIPCGRILSNHKPAHRHDEDVRQPGFGKDACADQDIGVNDDGWCLIRHEAVGTRLLQ